MINTLTLISALFAGFAIVLGSCSRNFSTALVTGLFIGLIHTGIVALSGAQSGSMPINDCALVKDALDAIMSTGFFTFNNARYAVYLAGSALVLMAVTIICYLVRWIICRIACPSARNEAVTQG